MREAALKLKLKNTLALIVFVTAIIVAILRYTFIDAHISQLYDSLVLIPFVGVSLYFQYKHQYTKIFDFFITTFGFTYLIYVIQISGGYTSPKIFWFFPFCAGYLVLYGFFFTFCFYLYFQIVNFALYSFSFFDSGEDALTYSILFFVCSTLSVVIAFFHAQYQEKYFDLKRKVDNMNSINKLKGGLLHEINNPLNIAQLYFKRISKETNPAYVKPINSSLERMAKIMHVLHTVEDLSGFEAQKYIEDQEIFNIVKDDNTKV